MIFSITLEENGGGNMPDMSGRVFKINVGKHRDVDNRFQFRVYKIKWLDLDPSVSFLQNYTEMWHYRTRPKGPFKFPKGPFKFLYLGDMDYKVH